DAPFGVFEGEDRHLIAFACLQRTDGRNDPADTGVRLDRLWPAGSPGVGARSGRRRLGQLADRPGAEFLQILPVSIGRMTAPVQAEGLLFKRKLLGLAPWGRFRQNIGRRSGLVLVSPAEELGLPFIPIALKPRAVFAGD